MGTTKPPIQWVPETLSWFISFEYNLHCVCFNLYCGGFILFFNVWVCVGFVVCVCMCGFCNVYVCVCV